jgi:hypothetical protein
VTAVTIAAAAAALEIANSAHGDDLRGEFINLLRAIGTNHQTPVFVAASSSIAEASADASKLVDEGLCARAMLLGRTRVDEVPVVWIAAHLGITTKQINLVRDLLN